MKLLVSVRSVDEALCAARAGVDFIDLKEPGAGALGGLPTATIGAIVDVLQRRHRGLRAVGSAAGGQPGGTAARGGLPDGGAAGHVPISATIGDVPTHEVDRIVARVGAVADCGVDYVKVGIERTAEARCVLDALAASGRPVVPVFIADQGLDLMQVAYAGALGFPGVMVDTANKRAGSLFDALPLLELRRFLATVRGSGALVGVAGALRVVDEPLLRELAPDFAGFRSAVCSGDRSGALEPRRLRELVARLHRDSAVSVG